MKILYICNEYPPHLHGGIGTFTRDIAESMSSQGNEVSVWGMYSGRKESLTEQINGVSVHRLPGVHNGGRINSIKYRIQFHLELKKFLKKNEFDIVECQEWLGLLPLGLKHKGYVIRLHGAAIFFDKILNRPGNRLTHLFEKMSMKRCKNLVAVSEFCGKKTLELCDVDTPFTTIYNSINYTKLSGYDDRKKVEHKIVFANSVAPKKGVFELVDAFNIIAGQYSDATLHIIGKLEYQSQGINIKDLLLDKIKPEFKNRLHITGWLSSADEVYNELATAHVCVYPSHMEGFGIAPVEPMAMKKSVLFMNNGPGPEVIEDGVSGLLVDVQNPKDIASKINQVFSDKEMADKLGEQAQIRAKQLFDRDSVFIKNNLDYYTKTLSKH